MPTRPGWWLLLGAAVCFVVGRLLGLLELYVIGSAAVLAVLVALAWVRRAVDLAAQRSLDPPHVSVGSQARVQLGVTARRRVPVVELCDPVEGTVGARLAIGPIPAESTRDVGYRIPTRRRGLLRLGPLRAELTDPLGLARRTLVLGLERTVTILPRVAALDATPATEGRDEPLAGGATRPAPTAGAVDVATLRPYVVGDDLRRVHWPSTARADELVVRGAEEHDRGRATIVLDCRSGALGPEAFELAVSQAAGAVHLLAQRGELVRLVTTEGLDTGLVEARRQELVLLEHLALVAQHPGEGALADLGPPSARALVLTGGPKPLPGAGAPAAAVHGAGS